METLTVGLLTTFVSLVGCTISFKHALFYRKADSELSKRVKRVFTTDGLIYLITMCFGLWALFDLSHNTAIIMHWIRIPLLVSNIWASYRLYSHYSKYH
jgi:hypothetical protein